MNNRHRPAFKAIALAVALTLILGVAPAMAARDRTPPTTPRNLRVTGMTAYSVSLAWDPSTDNSGSFRYKICCANTSSETFPAPAFEPRLSGRARGGPVIHLAHRRFRCRRQLFGLQQLGDFYAAPGCYAAD
jgi:hypothetical protein